MDGGKIVFGVILLVVAIYLIISMESLAARLIGGGIVALLGLASIIAGLTKKPAPKPKKKKK